MAEKAYIWLFLLSTLPSVSEAIKAMEDDPNPLEAVVASQAQLIEQLQARLRTMETRFTAMESRLANQEKEIGFNARFSTESTVSVTGTQNIVFDAVDLNLGNGYDKVSGMFTAPVDGLYQFSLHISHTPPGRVHVWLVKDTIQISEAEASGDDQYQDRSSNTVAVHLNAGQKVWPKRESGNSTLLQGAFRSSFTGFSSNPIVRDIL